MYRRAINKPKSIVPFMPEDLLLCLLVFLIPVIKAISFDFGPSGPFRHGFAYIPPPDISDSEDEREVIPLQNILEWLHSLPDRLTLNMDDLIDESLYEKRVRKHILNGSCPILYRLFRKVDYVHVTTLKLDDNAPKFAFFSSKLYDVVRHFLVMAPRYNRTLDIDNEYFTSLGDFCESMLFLVRLAHPTTTIRRVVKWGHNGQGGEEVTIDNWEMNSLREALFLCYHKKWQINLFCCTILPLINDKMTILDVRRFIELYKLARLLSSNNNQ